MKMRLNTRIDIRRNALRLLTPYALRLVDMLEPCYDVHDGCGRELKEELSFCLRQYRRTCASVPHKVFVAGKPIRLADETFDVSIELCLLDDFSECSIWLIQEHHEARLNGTDGLFDGVLEVG